MADARKNMEPGLKDGGIAFDGTGKGTFAERVEEGTAHETDAVDVGSILAQVALDRLKGVKVEPVVCNVPFGN